MSAVPQQAGGWWHDYVCPTHGVELSGRDGEEHLCRYGCRLLGDRFEGAWLALEHQELAREARVAARRFRDHGEPYDRERACEIVVSYAELYREIADQGWSARSESWMLRGKLFAQALSEAQWAVGIADAVITLGPVPELTDTPALRHMLDGLASTISESRRILVVDRNDQRNNYTAWLDAAGRMVALATQAIGGPAPASHLEAAVYEHIGLAVLPDGWEWEASTYYHVFVLRAYLLALRGVEPAGVPAAAVQTLRSMVGVLVSIAAPDGFLPALHDGPYDRAPMHREVLEIAVLSAQLLGSTGLDTVESWARERLGPDHDGLEDALDDWFGGAAVPGEPASAGSRRFAQAGFVVLRSADDRIHAVLDAGPHGGAHGHLDKLGLYLYGSGVRWQPAPGVPPYASALRHGHYARTVAHPTVRVDGADQMVADAQVTAFDAEAAYISARSESAIPGVVIARALRMGDGFLLDVVRVRTQDGAPRAISLGLRPAVDLSVTASGELWRSVWDPEGQPLLGTHRASEATTLELAPGRGPSDDPSRLLHVGEWSAMSSSLDFVSVYRVDGEAATDILSIDAGASGCTIELLTPSNESIKIEVSL